MGYTIQSTDEYLREQLHNFARDNPQGYAHMMEWYA